MPKPEANARTALRMLSINPDEFPSCQKSWGDSFINMPEDVPFLNAAILDELAGYFGASVELLASLKSLAAKVNVVPALKAYTWHLYYRLVMPSVTSGCSHSGFVDWPLPTAVLGDEAEALPVFAALGVILDAREKYHKDGYTENIIKDTLGVFFQGFEKTFRELGHPKFFLTAYSWMRLYLTARLVELGRFNFQLIDVHYFGAVLKNKRDGRKLLLTRPGLKYNRRGFVLQQDDPWAEGGWEAVFEENDDAFVATPIHPAGYALNTVVTCSKSDWEVILQPGDILMDMHIPAGGGMTLEAALDSFRKADSFFSQRYPDKFTHAFICHSWIFNTQFEERLPQSNVARLMRQCYLFPAPSTGKDGMFFLFGERLDDLSALPRDTSYRRLMLECLESGEHLRLGGMLLFAEDLAHFETDYYRRTFRID